MTAEEYRKMREAPAKKRNKYGATRTGEHASAKEHARSQELQLLQQQGIIHDLREQVRYVLIPSQYDEEGTLIERSCSYVADFVYTNDKGRTVVEDTKGFRTKDYRIKRKLMLHIYGIRIREI